MLPAWLASGLGTLGQSLIQGGVNYGFGALAAQQQEVKNIEMAKYQNAVNRENWEIANRYNSPVEQMKRFQEAGLNPNLIYGQGNSGNASSMAPAAKVDAPNYQALLTDVVPRLLQNKLMETQIALGRQKVDESGVKQELMQAQTNLVKANPYMRKEYVDSMVTQLASTARMKEQEASFMVDHQTATTGNLADLYSGKSNGMQKMALEMDMLSQKFNLGTADQQVKAQIIQSKEFQNVLTELQVKWMKDSEITPQHIYQGIMMLLSKLMR